MSINKPNCCLCEACSAIEEVAWSLRVFQNHQKEGKK